MVDTSPLPETLIGALREAGLAIEDEALLALLRGAAAAPHAPGWSDLIAPDLPPPLIAELEAARDALRTTEDDEPIAERLKRLRYHLEAQDLDGFFLPRTDRFGSEYLPAADERVAWLTGFTGSAAKVVVLRDEAAVFTDGRYALQVEKQVPGDLFVTSSTEAITPLGWLKDRATSGQRIGFDPMLLKKAESERIEKALIAKGASLVALQPNPVDAIWDHRPAAPLGPIRNQPLHFAGESSLEKRERLLTTAQKEGADAFLVTTGDGVAWLLNIRGGDIPYNPLCLGLVLVRKDTRAMLVTDPRKAMAGFTFEDDGIRLVGEENWGTLLQDVAAAKERVLVDSDISHLAILQSLETAGVDIVFGADPVTPAKAVKNAVEIDGCRAAHRRDGAALCRFLAWLDGTSGVDELKAVAALEAERHREARYRGPSFPTISGAGPNGAIVHYSVDADSNRHLEPGDVYLVDSGGQYADATTDVTRTIAIGEVDPAVCGPFTRVLQGHIAIARAVFPKGTTGTQLDTLARQALWRAGLDYQHGTGHGVGSYLCVHEGPQRIAKKAASPALELGMILSNEPGYYRADAFGIRLENLILVEGRECPAGGDLDLLGFETLTLAPFDRRLIDPDLMAAEEIQWLDAYHHRVFETIGPLLDEMDRAWLERATAPLAT